MDRKYTEWHLNCCNKRPLHPSILNLFEALEVLGTFPGLWTHTKKILKHIPWKSSEICLEGSHNNRTMRQHKEHLPPHIKVIISQQKYCSGMPSLCHLIAVPYVLTCSLVLLFVLL